MVLLAIADANYSFGFVDVGAFGRRSDGGVFNDSSMGQKFRQKEMNLPTPRQLTVDGWPLPYVLVGDEAFKLSDFMMRPFPAKGGLNPERKMFNYRLSRARRVVENAFGILVTRWRVFKKPIEASPDNTINIVLAIICLHNWLRQNENNDKYIPKDFNTDLAKTWREELPNSALAEVKRHGNHNSTREAIFLREQFCMYFSEEGAVPWQYD